MQEEIRSILKEKKPIGYYIHANWVFTSPLEKIGLMVMILLGWWKIFEFFIKF